MKKLILIRHGEYDHSDPMVADVNKGLTRAGTWAAETVAKQLGESGVLPDCLVVSPAVRTLESARVICKKLGVPETAIETKPDIYEAEKPEILRVVQQLDDSFSTVMLVGHNPSISNLLQHLSGSGTRNMAPADAVVLTLDIDHWRNAAFGKGEQEAYLSPPAGSDTGWHRALTFWIRGHIQKVELFSVVLIGLLVIVGIIIAVFSMGVGSGAPSTGSDYKVVNPE